MRIQSGGTTATAALLIRVEFTRPTNRAYYPAVGAVVGGEPTAWIGTLTYLCQTLPEALALADLYLATSDTIPARITGHDTTVDTWPHWLTGDPTITQDMTVNGVPAPWVLTVPVIWGTR